MQGAVAQSAVGIVAVTAGGLALGDGVARGQPQLCAHLAVAIQALLVGALFEQCEVVLDV